MRSLFGASPHRLRNNGSRDSNDGNASRGEAKRRSFAFMKYSPDRRSSASMQKSREHARQIAMQLSMNEPEPVPLPQQQSRRSSTRQSTKKSAPPRAASTFQPTFPEPSAFDDFNPFGHDVQTNNSFGNNSFSNNSFSNNSVTKAPAPQEDFFAMSPPPPRPSSNQQRRSNANSSNRSTTSSATGGGGFPMRDNSFDNESVASSSAYDMDFLPIQSLQQRDSQQQPALHLPPPQQQPRRSNRGRPPRNRAPSSEASFGSSSVQWPAQPQPQQTPPLATVGSASSKSMSTMPSNSSMQSTFAGQTATPPAKPMKAVSMTPPMSGSGGAAARRRMRSQLRHGSSGGSLQGSETLSFDGTPPASPISARKNVISSNGSVGSSNGGAARNRVANYTISGSASNNWQSSPSPSFRGGASVCSSVAESDIDLFDSQHGNGGFTFDAFGLDASEIDREVQEALQAIQGKGSGSDFGAFMGNGTATNTSTNTSTTISKPQDTSMDDFAPQAWDSPPGSRQATPTPKEQVNGDEGFVDGFRISKPSPLPMISLNRESPASSERSSSLSSITDHNTDGAPRRNVFKEKAGLTSSNNGARPSPVPPPKKKWAPPPGAVKMLTPPRHEVPSQRRQQQQQVQTRASEPDNYWNEHLNQIPNMLKVNPQAEQQRETFAPPQQAPAQPRTSTGLNAPKWQSAASRFASPPEPRMQPATGSSFQKSKEEEKKDDDGSEERDSHTETTSAMTTVVSEPQPASPRRQLALQGQASHREHQYSQHAQTMKRGSLEKLETNLPVQDDVTERKISPQEQRMKELEELRNGGLSSSPPSLGFKSQATLHHSNHEASQLKPQQERINECNDQRTSFASLRQRLKSPVESDTKSNSFHNVTPQSTFHRSQSPRSSASKSEVGVSSFTRQQMKVASLSSSASKSEANFSKSPRNSQHQYEQPEVHAVLNRVRGMSNNVLNTPKLGGSPTDATSAAPAFVGLKLRKTSPPAALQANSSGEETEQQATLQPQERHEIPRPETPSRRLSYRERRELELRKLSEQDQPPPMGSPRFQLQRTYSQERVRQQQQHQTYSQEQLRQEQPQEDRRDFTDASSGDWHENAPPVNQVQAPSPKKLTYRERRELELAKEREAQEQLEDSQKGPAEPERDVASLIRRRIAANKTKSSNSPTNDESHQSASPMGPSRLRPTGSGHRRSMLAPGDEMDADERSPRHMIPDQAPDSSQSPRHSHLEAPMAPQQEPPATASAGGLSALHAQLKQNVRKPETASAGGLSALHAQVQQNSEVVVDDDEPLRPAPPVSAGGLSALHSQLKQLQLQQSGDDGPSEEVETAAVGPKAAPRRIQAMVDGKTNFEKLEVTTAHSQSSDQHSNRSSPSRTPKATYAMLNAFLHGRDTITAQDEANGATPTEGDEEEVPLPPGSPPKAPTARIPDGRPALKDDPKYARYFTMLKIGMPMDVVKHAMVRDNLDPAVMDGDHNRPECIGVPLKDDPKYAKYFKMLKIGMPMEAVKHAMERDGLDSQIMDQDHNLPADTSTGKQDEGPKEKDSHRRARLHWKPLGKVRRDSLWAKIDEDPALCNIEIDEEEFAELFQAELQPDGQKVKKGKRIKSPKGAAVRVIDPKRANNGGIILARLKMSHDDMADVVDRIDENSMTAEQIENIIEYLPTREERLALESYMLEGGQDAAEKFDGLCECEKFMVSMMTVKHAKRKVRALLFKLQFESCLEALYQETHIVETSCDELSNSVRLRQLLGIVLTFGNRLNTAGKGKKKKAGAFTLDSLLKLNQAKAFDKKTTFLQYIVLIVNRNSELLLRFKDDLPTVFKADKVFWDQCISDLEEVENQLENVRRIALYQARHAAKFRRKKKKHHDGDDDEESLTDLSLSLEEEVEALRATPIGMFTLAAIKKVSFLRDRVESTKVKFNKLLEYFGEDEKKTQPHELFATIVKFCQDFEKAKEQVIEEEKKKKREERKRQNAANNNVQTPNKTTGKTPQRHSTGMMLRASGLQPNASRLIDDMKVAQSQRAAATPPSQQGTPQTKNPPTPVRSENTGVPGSMQIASSHTPQQSHHQRAQTHSTPRRRESAPAMQHQRAPSSNEHAQQVMASLRQGAHLPKQSSPRKPAASSSPGRYETYGASSRNASLTHDHRQRTDLPREASPAQSRGREASRGRPSPHHEHRPGMDNRGVAMDGVLPPGMQERSMAGNGTGVPHHMVSAPPPTTETQSFAARQKARHHSRPRTSAANPPQDPPAYSATQQANSQMHRQSSAAPTSSNRVADHASAGGWSAPVENANDAPHSSPNVPGASAGSSLMRNKLRTKRLMERKQRESMKAN